MKSIVLKLNKSIQLAFYLHWKKSPEYIFINDHNFLSACNGNSKQVCSKILRPVLVLVLLLVTTFNVTHAQLADCSSGTIMYSIWNDSTGSLAAKPSEIRSINYATGAVGPLMGLIPGTSTYTIKKTISGTTYYGSAALAVDGITKEFFVNTQMSSAGGKDIIRINTSTGLQTVIGTTPSVSTANVPTKLPLGSGSGLDNYHFVKMAISPSGEGYAIGVLRDTTLSGYTAATCNPLISFTTCGAGVPTAGCSTIKLLGFLPAAPATMTNWQLFNGDIAFDNSGNLYFATAAFSKVNGIPRYTDARLFKINAIDIPSVPGAGTIPMSFIADYNSLDSTVINGIAFSPLGAMYMSTRRFNGLQTSPVVTPFTNELYKSTGVGTAALVPGFIRPTVGYSIADIGSCYFPLTVLASNELRVSGKYAAGNVSLTWDVNNNTSSDYFEVQRSDDGLEFTTIAKVNVSNTDKASQNYRYSDPQSGFGKPRFYRIRQIMNLGMRFYSSIVKLNFSDKITSVSKAMPNPVSTSFKVSVELKTGANVILQLIDHGGRIVETRNYKGYTGSNKFSVDNLAGLKPGLYILETKIDDEVIREKIIKK